MKFTGFLFIWTVVFFGSAFVHSQEDEYIEGVLLDAETKEPIVFATVRIQGKALGVISNKDGGFKIPSKFKELGDTIVISCLGYSNIQIDLSGLQLHLINTIYLNQETEQLEEVIVQSTLKPRKKLDDKDILKKAIEKIPINYPSTRFSLVGYYRDYQIKENTYFNLNEAVVEVFDRGFAFDDYKTTKIKLLDYKPNNNFKRDSRISKPYDFVKKSKIIKNAYLSNQGGNEFTILRVHDAIRNYNKHTYSYVYVLQENFIEGHKFVRESDTYIDNEPLYVLALSNVEAKTLVRGRIYISKNNFAIHKLDYDVYSRKESLSRDQAEKEKAVNSGVKNEQLGALTFRVNVEYKEKEGQMYLNYISFLNKFQVTVPSEFQLISQDINFEKSRIELKFNNSPKIASASNKKKYKLFYRGKRLKVKEVKVKGKEILLYLEGINTLIDTENHRSKQRVDVNLEIKNVKDVYGNVFNRSRKYQFNQFREFFTQKVIKNFKDDISKKDLMLNTIPLYDSRQPRYLEELSSDYWMNTPLKNLTKSKN